MSKDMTAEKTKELWEEAQKRARENYGVDEWEELDKYQREDCVHAEYEKLIKEENEVNHFLSDAEKMRDFKELSKEEFLASYSYLTEEEYDNTAREVAKEIYNFYDEFTDEIDKPTIGDIMVEMGDNGVPATLENYIADIKDWQESFGSELSHKEIEASNDVIRFLSVPTTQFTLYEDLANIGDSMMFDSESCIAVLVTPEGKEATLEVRGEVRVTTHDENGEIIGTYRSYSEMPDDLKAKIADGSYLEDESIYVGNNNWFEFFYDNGTVCEVVDVENSSPSEIYSLMADMIIQIEGRDVVPPSLEVYSIATESGQYLQEGDTLGAEATRSIFYDRTEAENTLEMLNDTREEGYVLLAETPAGLEYNNQTVPPASQNYTLYCGKLEYEVTPEVQKVLEGAMYWSHCEKLDSAELRIAEKPDSKYTPEEIAELRHSVEQAQLTIRDRMDEMEKLGVPNWVGNGALAFGKDNDLRDHYMSEFFEKGKYSKEGNEKIMAQREQARKKSGGEHGDD